MLNPIVLVVATRPDAIKLAPVYRQLKLAKLPVFLCATTQHRELLQQVLDLFNLTPDISLDIMRENQSLDYITSAVVQKISDLFRRIKPQMVVVQGDTTSAYAAALAAFYQQIPVTHVEAGLRTGNLNSPFPEELNRIGIAQVSSLHFAPTPVPVLNLLHAGVQGHRVFCVGNTVVDALNIIRNDIDSGRIKITASLAQLIKHCRKQYRRMILLTTHRRESFGIGIENIISAVKTYALQQQDVCIIFPVHPNPQVRSVVQTLRLQDCSNIFCLEPVVYSDLVYLLLAVDWVMTDSGGIQEEASCLGKKVLVLRNDTERMEIVWAGLGKIVGTNYQVILDSLLELNNTTSATSHRFLYGDGKTSALMVKLIQKSLSAATLIPAQLQHDEPSRIPVAFPQQPSYAGNR